MTIDISTHGNFPIVFCIANKKKLKHITQSNIDLAKLVGNFEVKGINPSFSTLGESSEILDSIFDSNTCKKINDLSSLIYSIHYTDQKLFSATELEILEEVCRKYGGKNIRYIEDASHNESPWLKTSLLEEIPYALAADDNDCFGQTDQQDLGSIYQDPLNTAIADEGYIVLGFGNNCKNDNHKDKEKPRPDRANGTQPFSTGLF